MDYRALRQEFDDDSLGLGYAGLSDQAAADLLNEPSRSEWVDVPVSEVAAYLELRNIYEQLQAKAAEEGAEPALRQLCRKLLRMISNESAVETFRMSDPERRQAIQAMLDALVVGGAMTQAQGDGLLALAQRPLSRGEELGLGRVKPGHVQAARAVEQEG